MPRTALTARRGRAYNTRFVGCPLPEGNMRVMVNGQWREVDSGLTVAKLLEGLSLQPTRVAVERNRQLVPRAGHAGTVLAEDDRLEIVTLVGGG